MNEIQGKEKDEIQGNKEEKLLLLEYDFNKTFYFAIGAIFFVAFYGALSSHDNNAVGDDLLIVLWISVVFLLVFFGLSLWRLIDRYNKLHNFYLNEN